MLKIVSRRTLFAGEWLKFEEAAFLTRNKETKTWEYICRKKGRKAVIIIARLIPSDKIILIRQFRIPINNYIIEFPAGLIDVNETVESTAYRELLEETGYSGKVVSVYKDTFSSPGLTDESAFIVMMEVNEEEHSNRHPKNKPEDSEDIETIIVPKKSLYAFISDRQSQGDGICIKVASFAMGLSNISDNAAIRP